MASKTYREKRDNQKAWILFQNGKLVGVFSNLQKMHDFASQIDPAFPKYWELNRNKNKKIVYGDYKIYYTKYL